MTRTEFTTVLHHLLKEVVNKEKDKQNEYALEEDAFNNFKYIAKELSVTKEEALMCVMAKHTASIKQQVFGNIHFEIDKLKEKITDIILYLTLLYAMYKEKEKEN